MTKFRKIILVFFLFITALIALAYAFNVNYLFTAVRTIYLQGHTTAFLEDYKEFENRTLQKSTTPQPWAIHSNYNAVALTDELQKNHTETGTVAFLIIKNDSIWHESYYDGFTETSKSNSFSMAKSIVSAALGKAIQLGKVKDLDQKVIDFIPELKGKFAQQVTMGDLSSMSSGLKWDESYYSPFSVTTRAYFDDHLEDLLLHLPIDEEPGVRYTYLSGSTQMLAIALQRAVGMPLSSFVSTYFWEPLGATETSLWQVDRKDGIEKAYCCIASNARDFARFGKLYLQKGQWNGKEILPAWFVEKSVQARFADYPEYGYGFWLAQHLDKSIFYMRGHLGQYVIVVPEDNLIIVRLGHKSGKKIPGDAHTEDFYLILNETYKLLAHEHTSRPRQSTVY